MPGVSEEEWRVRVDLAALYLARLAHGDVGVSIINNIPVAQELGNTVSPTIELMRAFSVSVTGNTGSPATFTASIATSIAALSAAASASATRATGPITTQPCATSTSSTSIAARNAS